MATSRVVKRTVIYDGRWYRVVRDLVAVNGRRITREAIFHPGAVVVVPLLDDGRVVLVRQYRHAVGKELLELPAGTLEPKEPRVACAKRELEEETGWRAARMRRIAQFYTIPGLINEMLTVYVATSLRRTVARPDPDEMVRPVILSLRTALARVRSGAICDAKTIIGLTFTERLLAGRKEVV